MGFFFSRPRQDEGFQEKQMMNPTTVKENYTPGHTANASRFMAARDLESHGFFLLPLLQSGFDVLDAGCGPATISADIADAVFPGKVTAIDICPSELEHGRRLAEGREIVNLEFLAASVYEIPFADSSFNVVFSHALIEHLSDPHRALREFHRVTRPGGFVALVQSGLGCVRDQPVAHGCGSRDQRLSGLAGEQRWKQPGWAPFA